MEIPLTDEEDQRTLFTLLSDVKNQIDDLREESRQMRLNSHDEIESTNYNLRKEVQTRTKEIQDLKQKVSDLEEAKNDLQGDVAMLRQDQHRQQTMHFSDDFPREGPSNSTTPRPQDQASRRSIIPSIFLRHFPRDDGLPPDTFTLMMTSQFRSSAWVLGIITFVFQMVLTAMISINQIKDSDQSSDFNVPFKVDNVVRVGQLLTIIFTLATQTDIISAVRFVVMFWNDPHWDKVVLRRKDGAPPPTEGEWFAHILVPNFLKFSQGCIVIFVTFVLIVQSDNIIDLLKDFTALMGLSETDNIVFWLAVNGYLGQELQRNTIEARDIEIQDEVVVVDKQPLIQEASVDSFSLKLVVKRGFVIRSISLLLITFAMIGGWGVIVHKQINGTYFHRRYQNCRAPDDDPDIDMFKLAKEHFGDGTCYGGPLNTLGCGFEGGDCVNFNLAFPSCKGSQRIHVEESLGNGKCNPLFMNKECDYDGGDCCPYAVIKNNTLFGDGQCNGGILATKYCGFDNGDCNDFNRAYPDCPLDTLSEIEGAEDVVLGDGVCDGGIYNTVECGYEFGDCNGGQYAQDIIIPERIGFGRDIYFNTKMSLQGNTMAIGLRGTDKDGKFDANNPGLVRMMRYDPEKKVWEKLGDPILGEAKRDNSGASIALSSDGNRIATNFKSFVRVLQVDPSSPGGWSKVGEEILSTKVGGGGISMNADGSRLAIADSEDSKGRIMIYHLDASPSVPQERVEATGHGNPQKWIPLGQSDINGRNRNEYIGSWNLQLNALDGSKILFSVGAHYTSSSKIRVYQRNPNATMTEESWTQMGGDISSPFSSSSVINSEGNRIAISRYSTSTKNPGEVLVLDYDVELNKWVQIGAESIMSSAKTKGDGFGYSITMSSDGNFLVIGSNNPECQSSPNAFDTEICTTKSVEFYVYESYSRYFRKVPAIPDAPNVKGNILDLIDLSDRSSSFGLHFSMNGNGTSLSISGYNTRSKSAFVETFDLNKLFYTRCAVSNPEEIGNGVCFDHEPYNSEACGFDGGDCIVDGYPNCFVDDPAEIGNGSCNLYPPYNTENCGWDGGDCKLKSVKGYSDCFVPNPEEIRNGKCTNYPPYNTEKCGRDDGDCIVEGFPNCYVDNPAEIGDGHCNDEVPYNTKDCGFDGGDCVEVPEWPNCHVGDETEIGNGDCKDRPPYNTEDCGYDGGDCARAQVHFYPDCLVNYVQWVGDNHCHDWPPYNTQECGYDGGDCILKRVDDYLGCIVHNPEWIGDGFCKDRPPYNTKVCGYDGGDCNPVHVGNYTDCFVHNPEQIGDGICNDWSPYNTKDCGFDGGDCTHKNATMADIDEA